MNREDKTVEQDRWKRREGYGERWVVESTISNFKRMFGESVFSRRNDMKQKEILLKAIVYNNILEMN
jgi:hypothetical protein